MHIITKKLSDLIPPDKNIRIHTDKQLKEFEKSIRMFGQIRPIVIDEDNVILAGNGLYETLQRMKKEEAECCQYTDLTENQKKKLMIADNKVFSLGIENLDTLNHFLVELHGDLDIPGFDEEILKQMVSDADAVTEKIAEYGTLDDDEIRNIRESNKRKAERSMDNTGKAGGTINAVIEADSQESRMPPEDTDAATDLRRFVVCMKCGEKIWL